MDFLICQTFAASPAEPGELLFGLAWPMGHGDGHVLPPVASSVVGKWRRCNLVN